MSPLVDIGVLTYKPSNERLGFLRVAIESVLAQTFTDWRLVVSENGPDPSPAVAEALVPFLQDRRILHVPTRADLTGSANGTIALRHGSAPYVTLLHDDDWWEPEFLERRVEFLRAHPECGFVFGGNLIVDEYGQEISRTIPALRHGVHSKEEYVPLLLRSEGVPQAPTALIRREALETVGTSLQELYPAWDYDLYFRLGLAFPTGYLDVWDSAFRVHLQQQTYSMRWGEQRIVFEEVIDELLLRGAPHLRRPPRERVKRRSRAFVSAALDAAETGERRRSLRLAATGIRFYPRSLANPRLPAILATLVLGARVRPILTRVRTRIRRRDYVEPRKQHEPK